MGDDAYARLCAISSGARALIPPPQRRICRMVFFGKNDVVLNNELHQCLLILVTVSNGATDLRALQALPAKWDCTNFLPRLDIVNFGKPLIKSRPNNQPCFGILATKYDEADDLWCESPCLVCGNALINDDLQVCVDGDLEGTVALVRLLGHSSCVGNAGIKNKPVNAEVGKECWVESPQAAVAFENNPPSSHGCRVQK